MFTKDCARRCNSLVAALQKQAPSALMVGKFAVEQAVREVRNIVVRPAVTDDVIHD